MSHAKWLPSAAHRLLNCPASLQLSEMCEKPTSEYAEAGHIAHAIAEQKALHAFCGVSRRKTEMAIRKLRDDKSYSPEMEAYTDAYVDELHEHAWWFLGEPYTALEVSVPIGIITGEKKPSGEWATGTADCIQIGTRPDDYHGEYGAVMWITDYKNGAGVAVDAYDNPQMKMYALGALELYKPIYGDTIDRVMMTIVQPALNNIQTFELPTEELIRWAEEVVKPKVAQAFSADPGEPCAGDWCRFCPARHRCKERARVALEVGKVKKDMLLMTNDEIGEALTLGATLTSWYSDLKDYSLSQALEGKTIAGYKVVAGRGSRAWTDTDAAFDGLMSKGVAEAVLYERKPVSVAGLEKVLGKKQFGALASEYVVNQPGKPTLVPESDKRPPYNPAEAMFGRAE